MPHDAGASGRAGHGAIALCYGTRPQIIKASVLRRALAATAPLFTIDTGQHYDYELNALLYAQLGVEPADVCLEVRSGSHAVQTAAILTAAEQQLASRPVRCVIVIGDTNSTLGCALAAAKLRLPVVHVEAGLRADDPFMAEELNRRAVDAIAHVLCTPSAAATAAVRRERHDAEIVETGDVAYDVLRSLPAAGPAAVHVAGTRPESPYIVATLHRAELTDDPALLARILDQLAQVPCPAYLPMHPRTRAALDQAGLEAGSRGTLAVLPPIGYLESVSLIRNAAAVVTDSGGVQREAYWLGVPCLTVRGETEWRETVACGANQLLPPATAADSLARSVAGLLAHPPSPWDRGAYGQGDAAARIAAVVASFLQDH